MSMHISEGSCKLFTSSCTHLVPFTASRLVMKTCAPFPASAKALAKPRPVLAPVTRTTLPVISGMLAADHGAMSARTRQMRLCLDGAERFTCSLQYPASPTNAPKHFTSSLLCTVFTILTSVDFLYLSRKKPTQTTPLGCMQGSDHKALNDIQRSCCGQWPWRAPPPPSGRARRSDTRRSAA